MTRSTTSFSSAATTSPPISIELPGPRPFRPGPRSPAWPLWHSRQGAQPKPRVSPRPQPHKLTVPRRGIRNTVDGDDLERRWARDRGEALTEAAAAHAADFPEYVIAVDLNGLTGLQCPAAPQRRLAARGLARQPDREAAPVGAGRGSRIVSVEDVDGGTVVSG